MFVKEKEILPEFPRTAHLPHKPNTDKTDRVATDAEAAVIWTALVNVEEKIDGASCGMTLHEGEPLIRSRDHILRKGYHKKNSAAKAQFASVWNWWYANKAKFEFIAEAGPYSVYGEWCVAQHGIAYNRLPDWFIAYDLYNYDRRFWEPSDVTARLLHEAGFNMPSLLLRGRMESLADFQAPDWERLEGWANLQSAWSDTKAEGFYLKVFDSKQVTHRFKMVREDYVRGALWHPNKMTKNKVTTANVPCPSPIT
jgi:atypical dual specificity phosphatase